ncbi:hypothetical protein DNK01_18215 [Stutzerimonas kirkiae]|nr:hypothetical protein DNK01_18215 [Stutzerimonas kirkiae]
MPAPNIHGRHPSPRRQTSKAGILRSCPGALAAFLLLPAITQAEAYADPPPEAVDAPYAAALEVVTVTSRKREELLQDVPLAITAYSGKELNERGVNDSRELFDTIPNLFFGRRASGLPPVPVIRGVYAAGNDPTIEPSVGFYVDGVYISSALQLDMSLLDIDSVEVLRGPQGTLYGKNTLSGAINIITRNPGDQPVANARVAYGNRSHLEASASVGGPLIEDKLLVKLTAARRKNDPFLYNNVLGRKVEHDDYTGALLSLRALPSDRLSVDLKLDTSRSRPSAGNAEAFSGSTAEYCRARPTGSQEPSGNCPAPWASNPFFAGHGYDFDEKAHNRVVSSDIESTNDQAAHGASLHAVYTGDYLELTSITSYRRFKDDITENRDGSAYPLLNRFGLDYDTRAYSQELRLTSVNNGALQWTLGLFGFKDERKLGMDTGSAAPGRPGLFNAGSASTPIFLDDFRETSRIESDSLAAFGQASYDFNDAWSLTLGARYTRENREISLLSDCDGFACPYFAFAPRGITPNEQKSSTRENIFTPLATLSYRPVAHILTYLSASKGYKSGGYAPVFTFSVRPFDSEEVWNYEAGAKSSWLGGRLTANLAVFHMDWKDVQISSFTGSAGFLVQNAASVINQGIELEVSSRLSERFGIGGSYGFLDSHYDMPLAANSASRERRRPNSPRHSLNLYADYRYPLGGGWNLHARSDYSLKSGIIFRSDQVVGDRIQTGNSGLTQTYGLANARLGVESGDWGIHLWGKNLFDKNYYLSAGIFEGIGGGYYGIVGDPRSYGLELSVKL